MLELANPWMLAALGAVCVPVLVHLFYLAVGGRVGPTAPHGCALIRRTTDC